MLMVVFLTPSVKNIKINLYNFILMWEQLDIPHSSRWITKIPTLVLNDEIETVRDKVIYLFTPENSNLEPLMNEINSLISNVWEKLIESSELWNTTSFTPPSIVFFDWEIELEERSTSNIFYYSPTNSIYINRYNFVYLLPYTWNSIWLVVMLAHEIWHVLQNMNSCSLKKFYREQNADFLSWFIMKNLQEEWIIDDEAVELAKKIMSRFWTFCDNNFIRTMKPNIHWNGSDRQSAFEKWFNASTEHALLSFR